MGELVLVTGATGQVGLEVVRALTRLGATVRAGVRDPEGARGRLPAGADPVFLDFERPGSFAEALAGASRVFLVRPPQLGRAEVFRPFLKAARRAGVAQVVFLSLLGAQHNPLVPHHGIERLVRASGIPGVFLRASFFMQNLSGEHQDEIRRGRLDVPAGHGRTSFIDARDIAAVAAQALTGPVSAAAHDLTGSAALDYFEVAHTLTEVLGRPVTYTMPGTLQFVRARLADGTPPAYALVMAAIYTSAALGRAGRVTQDVQRLLGRPPTTLRQFAQDVRAVWTADG